MADEKYKVMELKDLKVEDGARELASSPDMEPYMRLIETQMTGGDPAPALEALRQLPLEKRYIWRVASALKWAFADCEDWNVAADKQTLAPEDLAKVMDLLKLRPAQFCIFLQALVGAEEMQRRMAQAIGMAKRA